MTHQFHEYNSARRFEVSAWLTGLICIASLGLLPFQKHQEARIYLALCALGTGIAARNSARGAQLLNGRIADFRDISDQMYTQKMATEMYTEFPEPGREEVARRTEPRKVFKIEMLVTEKEKYPHILIVGETGNGKTLLAEYLNDLDKDSTRTFISPCRDDNEFTDYEYIGVNFDYNSIGKFMTMMVTEMEARYKLKLAEVVSQYGFRNIIIDEGRDVAQNTKEFTTNLLRLISMARKRFMRVWLCTTGQSVKALELEGEGEMRRNFVYVRLGREAEQHARKLVAEGKYTKEDLQWFLEQAEMHDHAAYALAMVDDMFCILPNLADYRARKLERGTKQLPAAADEVDFAEVQELLEGGTSKTAICRQFNIVGQTKRAKFWEEYEKYVEEA